jgi:hypothetical protein
MQTPAKPFAGVWKQCFSKMRDGGFALSALTIARCNSQSIKRQSRLENLNSPKNVESLQKSKDFSNGWKNPTDNQYYIRWVFLSVEDFLTGWAVPLAGFVLG